jgi:multidrug efflux pump
MTLPELCIKKPVFATVISLMILLIGFMSYTRLGVREYPNIDEPVVTVSTSYPGASAEIMESQVTVPLEESLAGIEGIDMINSISREEISQITVRFKVDRNIDLAANDVRDRVGRTRDLLPDDVLEPIIAKVEADAQPIIYLAFSSSNHGIMEVSDYADRYVKDALQTLPGVAEVKIMAERRYSMRIWLDRARLAAYSLTTQDIEGALRRQNIEIPAGRIESAEREFSVLTETDMRTEQQFRDLIVKDADGYLVRLSDVARVEVGPLDERIIARFNGETSVALGIVKQSVANPLDISNALREVLPRLQKDLPEGMKINIAYDSSIFIDKSISNVYHTIIEAIILVMIVTFVFLRNLRATIIPLVTIPISLVGAFALMYMFGFSINTLTLLAMVLAVGLVVDDAIVMLENIARRIEEGETPLEASLKGGKEISFAIIAMTITLAAVYAPIAFMEGRTGRLFTEFALTLAGAVIVSGFVALTLTPMMCSKILKANHNPSKFYIWSENVLNGMTNGYKAILTAFLRIRPVMIMVGVLVALVGGWVMTVLPSELSPTEDRGTIMGIAIAPEGSTVDYTNRYMTQIEGIISQVPEAKHYFVAVGFPEVTQGIVFVSLDNWKDRNRKQQDIVNELTPQMFGGVTGVMSFALNLPSLGQSPGNKPVSLVVQTSGTYEELETIVNQIVGKAYSNPGLNSIDSDLKLNKPRLKIEVDREKAAALGVEVETLGRTIETMLGGRQVTRFKIDGKQYDVMVQVDNIDRSNPEDITNIQVRTASGEMVPLSNLVTITETVAPKELNHFNRLRSATITANLTGDYPLSDALDYLEGVAQESIKGAMQIDYSGVSREFKQSGASMYVTFVLALGFIFMVLAAQFESFKAPFIILLSVPLSMTGALLALYFTGTSLNVYSQIGLVTLIGLITKHGILIVEFANIMQEEGKSKMEAVIEASALRLRPILMTTGAMVLGTLPLALATGAGAESRAAIGWVIVGGMTLGTFFTLFVIPTVYTYIAYNGQKLRQKEKGKAVSNVHGDDAVNNPTAAE